MIIFRLFSISLSDSRVAHIHASCFRRCANSNDIRGLWHGSCARISVQHICRDLPVDIFRDARFVPALEICRTAPWRRSALSCLAEWRLFTILRRIMPADRSLIISNPSTLISSVTEGRHLNLRWKSSARRGWCLVQTMDAPGKISSPQMLKDFVGSLDINNEEKDRILGRNLQSFKIKVLAK